MWLGGQILAQYISGKLLNPKTANLEQATKLLLEKFPLAGNNLLITIALEATYAQAI